MAAPWFSIPHKHRLQQHSKTPAAQNILGTAGKGNTYVINVNPSDTHQNSNNFSIYSSSALIHYSKLTIQNSFPLFSPATPLSPHESPSEHLTQKANS